MQHNKPPKPAGFGGFACGLFAEMLFDQFEHHRRQQEDGDPVGNHHEAVDRVGNAPDQRVQNRVDIADPYAHNSSSLLFVQNHHIFTAQPGKCRYFAEYIDYGGLLSIFSCQILRQVFPRLGFTNEERCGIIPFARNRTCARSSVG